jgi:hypothetical protein
MTDKKKNGLYPSFKKRGLKKNKPKIKKEHMEIISPPGQ